MEQTLSALLEKATNIKLHIGCALDTGASDFEALAQEWQDKKPSALVRVLGEVGGEEGKAAKKEWEKGSRQKRPWNNGRGGRRLRRRR